MNIQYRDDEDSDERDALIQKVLPKETLISTILEPSIEKHLFGVIAKCIREELEVYRNYPKRERGREPIKKMLETFDPRNNETCFQGKAFKANSHITDYELTMYRKSIGTIPHPVWGNCTLMEIWGGDHFEEHNAMVVGAFKYGMNLIKTCPTIKVFVNPLFQNKKSKTLKLSKKQQEYQDWQEELLTKALIFGVNEPTKKKRRR